MKNLVLTINTVNPEKTVISLSSLRKPACQRLALAGRCGLRSVVITKKIWRAKTHQSEELLPAIDELLRKNKVGLKNLGQIIVNIGPGSFTGTRVGVATANALSFALKIPVVGIKGKNKSLEKITPSGYVAPFYNQKPNITTPKNK